MDCARDSLSSDMYREIVTTLWQRREKESLNALMQTSRELRLLVSSFISVVSVSDVLALRSFRRDRSAVIVPVAAAVP